VHTARWAEGRHVEKLLAAIADAADRSARYVCELVLLAPDGSEYRGTGVLEGRIADEAAGSEGFGFDPVFVPSGETLPSPSSATRGRNDTRTARGRRPSCWLG
jgi:Xanthosine triphosphate pyrophosphatase